MLTSGTDYFRLCDLRAGPFGDNEELLSQQSPRKWQTQICARQERMRRQTARERIRQKSGIDAAQLKPSSVKMLLYALVGENHSVVGEVKVFPVAVTKVGTHHRNPTVRGDA